ncbi:MAG: serine/threonine protein kinase, partial [Gemmatimonadales bacterium]|nr:serine/threonine protein kinase [Gemmatimonadales bacterium]
VVICFAISLVTFWQEYLATGHLPNLTWVPAVVIMFPLILPGPPRRTLVATALAALMSPLALLVLDLSHLVTVPDAGAYFQASFGPGVGVGFAYLAARVVYGLGREVARARELGSYRLGELLGRGGMGEVYRATHRMLARPAAIKLIRPEMLGSADAEAARQAVRRFRLEAEAAASLRSPHTVELYDFGVTEDQTLYFVMELLDGMDLERLVRETGPLPAGRVIHILRQVCESLEEAHARGLVHRDIKPANLHLGRLGLRHDFVKVLDFGLVKSVVTEGGGASHPTAAGFTAGTPAYMAPEVALGEAVDGRADLYALGCVGYFLLTGRTVFDGGHGLQLIARHLQERPVPPSTRAELPVPPALDRLLLACLAKRPADRPADAAALAMALAAVPAEPWGEAQAAAWWRGHRPAA